MFWNSLHRNLRDPSHTAAVFGRSLKHFFSQSTSVHSASEAFATMRYINWCFTYSLKHIIVLNVFKRLHTDVCVCGNRSHPLAGSQACSCNRQSLHHTALSPRSEHNSQPAAVYNQSQNWQLMHAESNTIHTVRLKTYPYNCNFSNVISKFFTIIHTIDCRKSTNYTTFW